MTIFVILAFITSLLALLFLYALGVYNKIIIRRNQVMTDFSDVDIQIKRRASLIQTLTNYVREYAKHEKSTFEKVTKARTAVDNSRTPHESAKADNMLTETLRSLFMVVENYPKLVASQNYKGLRKDLLDTENLIANYRETYNISVQKYNNYIQTFPRLLVAKAFGFFEEELFQSAKTV